MDKESELPEKLYQYLLHLFDTSTTYDVYEFLANTRIYRDIAYRAGYDIAYNFILIVDPEVYKKYQNRLSGLEEAIRAKYYKFRHEFVNKIETFPDLNKFQILHNQVSKVDTPWIEINNEQNHLLKLQRSVQSTIDYQNIGNACRTLLQKLADTVFDSSKHIAEDKNIDLGESKFKNRLHTYIKSELVGPGKKELRDYALSVITVAEKSVDLANKLTHDLNADSLIAESCIISTITVISIIKLIAK